MPFGKLRSNDFELRSLVAVYSSVNTRQSEIGNDTRLTSIQKHIIRNGHIHCQFIN